MPASITALVAGFVGSLLLIGLVLSLILRLGLVGVIGSIVVASGLTAAAYFLGDTLALRLTGAAPADATDHARLVNLTDGLCVAVGVSKPSLYVTDDDSANAFACGRDQHRAAVVVTRGLLEHTSRIELEGVLARELQQIKSGEATFNTLLTGLLAIPVAGSDRALRYWWAGDDAMGLPRTAGRSVVSALCLVFVPFAVVSTKLVHLFVPEQHDAFADLAGVEVTRYPPGLAGALDQMRKVGTVVPRAGRVTAHLWVAEPLPSPSSDGFAGRTVQKLSTHVSLEPRIDALREL